MISSRLIRRTVSTIVAYNKAIQNQPRPRRNGAPEDTSPKYDNN